MYDSLLRHFGNRVATISALVASAVFSVALFLNIEWMHVHIGAKRVRAQTASPMMMPVIAPLFIEGGRFTSTLVLVNGSKLFTYADVIVADLDGREIARQRVDFSPHSQRRVQLREVLSVAGSIATTGRVEIIQSPELKGRSIAAQLSLTDLGSGEPTFIDEEVSMPSASGSQTLRAVADKADGSPLVAITSLTDSEQHIIIDCFSGNKRFSKSVTLSAGETLLTEAAEERTLHGASFDMVSGNANWHGAHRPVGITLTSDAAPGSFAAFGLAPHGKKDNQFFSAINFADPKMLRGTTIVFTGVPVGSSTLLPQGQYVPQLALANFSSKDLHVSVKHTLTSGSSSTVNEVANVKIRARSSHSFSLDNLKGGSRTQEFFPGYFRWSTGRSDGQACFHQ